LGGKCLVRWSNELIVFLLMNLLSDLSV
jgi:hypothetical protein